MKNIKKKVLGIFLAAVMVISGLTFAGDYIYAVGSEDTGMSTFQYDPNPNIGTCKLDAQGNPIKDNCLYENVYFDHNGKRYPAMLTATELSIGTGNGDDGNWINMPHDSPMGTHPQDYPWEKYYELINENHTEYSDFYKNSYTHYVSIHDNPKSDQLSYVRCDYFMNHMVNPGDKYKVTFRVWDDNKTFIFDSSVNAGNEITKIPTNSDLPEPYKEGYVISKWVYEDGSNVDFNELKVNGPITLYAVLQENKEEYSLIYDSNINNESNEYDGGKYLEGQSTQLKYPSEIFEPMIDKIDDTDVIFVGWSENKESVIYADSILPLIKNPGDEVIMDSDKTFYAVWAADENGNGTPDYKEGSIQVTKLIDELTNIEGQGKPTFVFKIENKDKSYIDYKIITMDEKDKLEEPTVDGFYYSESITFEGLPAGTYTITELDGIRYGIKDIKPEDGDPNLTTQTIEILLNEGQNRTDVEFHNTLKYENNISDTDALKNTFKLDEDGNVIYVKEEVD